MSVQGETDSEKYLRTLSEKTFLELWTCPKLYNREGKELCDLLVIFGEKILIFSDKHINCGMNEETHKNWRRFYVRAIENSLKQIRGAIRYIKEYPTEIFLDQQCKKPFLLLKIKEPQIVVGICTVRGAREACLEYYGEGSGSLRIDTCLRGEEHYKTPENSLSFFTVGDINPSGEFIHIMDEVVLDCIMRELDTIEDFTNYLIHKSSIIREGIHISAGGEEEILAAYMNNHDEDGKRCIVDTKSTKQKPDLIFIPEGEYLHMIESHQYIEKKKDDKISYEWDALINRWSQIIKKNIDCLSLSLSKCEEGLRCMASENRYYRKILSLSLQNFLNKAQTQDIFTRAVQIKNKFYLFISVKNTINLEKQYFEELVSGVSKKYCLVRMKEFREKQDDVTIIGITFGFPSDKSIQQQEVLEGLQVMESSQWTSELEMDAKYWQSKGAGAHTKLVHTRYEKSVLD